jgi:hypothetical protein
MENGNDDDEDDVEGDGEESLSRALADLEIVASAYPDEVQLPGNLQRWMQRGDNGSNDSTRNAKEGDRVQFPIRFTLYFDPISFVLLEITAGYPSRGAGLRVVSFRNNSSENKARMELAVSAIREASLECLEDGVEAGLMCCSAGLDRWNEGVDGALSSTPCDTSDDALRIDEAVEGSNSLVWVSGDPIVEKKSVFQAHVCRISTEAQAQPALRILIGGSSKLQRATHNMVRCGFDGNVNIKVCRIRLALLGVLNQSHISIMPF